MNDDAPAVPTSPRPRRRRRWLLLAGGFAVVVGAVAFTTKAVTDEPVAVDGRPRLELSLPALEGGGRVDAETFAGKPTVVNFWASWCSPCRREMPDLAAAAEAFEGDVNFVGVNHQDNRQDARDFAASVGVAYASGFDPRGETAKRIGLRGMPTTLFVDQTGRILEQRTGEISRASLDSTILRLFGVEP